MISEIFIENLAVIRESVINFGDNLNVFTGETGAGKSILINGINAILGQRITKDIVRTGCSKAIIVALFKNISSATKEKLDELGISCTDGELSITREIFADGGSVARVNSRATTVMVLREIGETLINIHGQHDSQVLLSPEKHIVILDSFANFGEVLIDYQESFKRLQELARKIKKLTVDETEKAARVEMLNYKISEIEAVDIEENEDVAIEEEYKMSKNSDLILKSLLQSKVLLSGDSGDGKLSAGIIDQTEDALVELFDCVQLFAEAKTVYERMNSIKLELLDIFEEVSDMSDRVDLDQNRFEAIKKRRDEIAHIKKRYGPELADVIRTCAEATHELEELGESVGKLEELKSEKQTLLAEVSEKAKILSNARAKAAKDFVEQVTAELEFLDMPNVKLDVKHQRGKLTINGMDNIEFLISANLGEPPKSISKIASGGELSRIMLALKSVIAGRDNIDTLIFDEIDTGVSGRAAQKIGIKLAQIGKIRQVLCVTHLAQLAIMANTHLMIEKKVIDGSTVTEVKQLDFNGRKEEIARIMGGNSELMLKNAEELLKGNGKGYENI